MGGQADDGRALGEPPSGGFLLRGLHPRCRLLAPLRHADGLLRCPFIGVEQNSRFGAVRTVVDPERTFGSLGRRAANIAAALL